MLTKKLCVKFISTWNPHIQAKITPLFQPDFCTKLTQAFNPHFCVSFSPASTADPPMKAYIIDGDLHFIFDDSRLQMTAEVDGNGDLLIGYDNTQMTNIRMDGNNLFYDFLGA
ncbi:hypothetical protein FACS1894110_09770 [Spirochaetia bacterium]|nr:hypothetical protein FACS1894110_09770 [Spirochaetia bacterium]